MNETQDRPEGSAADSADTSTEPGASFDAHRLRTITDMRRSKDDRLLAGVCGGAAKYLNVDPVVLRVLLGVLTFVGLSGLILYAAAWFLLPEEDAEKSVAADWFNLDKNEEQIRITGLVGAGVLAVIAVVGDQGWAWWGVPWVLVPLAALYWLFVVRPRRRDADLDDEPSTTTPMTVADLKEQKKAEVIDRKVRRKAAFSPALTVLTLSIAAITVAVSVLVVEANDGTAWTTYVAIALGVVAVGLLVSAFYGNGGPLVPVGGLLAIALALGTLLPSPAMGERRYTPTSATEVVGHYENGMGLLMLDLGDLRDPDELLGSTIGLDHGFGQTKVVVPSGLNVRIDAELTAGEIRAFDRKADGTDADLVYPATRPDDPALTLRIRQSLGNVEVVRR